MAPQPFKKNPGPGTAKAPKCRRDIAYDVNGSKVKTYPIGHFDIYEGANFETAVQDQLDFLKRVFGQ